MKAIEEVVELPGAIAGAQVLIGTYAPPTVAEILRRAAHRVSLGWCQHYLAIRLDGIGTFARADVHGAKAHCMLGALYCENDREQGTNIRAAYEAIVRAVGTSLLADWNDARRRTQDQVVDALMRASEIAEES